MFIYQFDVFGFFLTESSGSAQHVAFLKKKKPRPVPISQKKSDAPWHTRNANVFRSEAPSVKITLSGLLLNEFCNLPISALQCGAHSMTRPTWFLKEIASSFTQLFPFSTLLDCFVTKSGYTVQEQLVALFFLQLNSPCLLPCKVSLKFKGFVKETPQLLCCRNRKLPWDC